MEQSESVENDASVADASTADHPMEAVAPELVQPEPEHRALIPERAESSDLNSVEAVSSMEVTPIGSPVDSNTPLGGDDGGSSLEQSRMEDVSRAGRKRKANSRYMEEPSPVLKPAVRRPSVVKKQAPPSPKSKKLTGKEGKTDISLKEEEALPLPAVTGPPTFGSILFGRRRKLSESLSDEALLDEEIPDIVSEDEEELVTTPVVASSVSEAVPRASTEPVKLEGNYVASGAAGPTVHGMIKTALVHPCDGTIKFPDMVSEEYLNSRPVRPRVYIPVDLGGGGPLSLLPSAPVGWFRDEIPKLSAYFRKKMEGGAMAVPSKASPVVASSLAGEKKPSLTEAQREERRRQKETERKRLIEERNRRRERERLKQLYRQHWLALTKFPIEDELVHSHKGIRRLGHAPPQCRQVSSPVVYWDCRLGGAGALEIPLDIKVPTTELLDEVFVIWNFFVHFWPFLQESSNPQKRFSLADLVEGIFQKKLTPVISEIHWSLIHVMRPWIEHQLAAMLQAEQALESQLTKNRGRAKLYWSAICQFRDLLFLGYSIFVKKVSDFSGGPGSADWLWQCLFLAKAIVLLDAIDYRSKEFLGTISTAFEEIDFEHKWIFDWELNASWNYASMPFEYRVKLLKLLIDKIVSLPVIKKAVDLSCESRNHITAELAFIEKEERKLTQRIALHHKDASLPETAAAQDLNLRESFVKARRISLHFMDKELAVRLESLGRDRHMNEYFQISSDRDLVFVRQHSVSHPNVVRYGVYDSLANIEALIQSLDERGVRELNLKGELQKVKTAIFSAMMARGESDFEKTRDWLGIQDGDADLPIIEDVQEFGGQLKFLNECMTLTRSGITRIKDAWFGRSSLAGVGNSHGVDDDDDDDVTVDEGVMSSPNDSDDPMSDSEQELSVCSMKEKPFRSEHDSLFDSITALSNVLTEGFKSSLFAFPKPGETTATSSSILIQFHVKSGSEFLKQVLIPAEKVEFIRLVESLYSIPSDTPEYKKKMIQISSVFLDGLSALDDVIHDEISRIDSSSNSSSSLEVWAASGGEKHAWKSFIGFSEQNLDPSSPGGEEEEGQQVEPSSSQISQNNMFKCDSCEKTFKYHILLGVHKLHPCKTRGRKPIPVDPLMEVFPIAQTNGMIAIDRIANPEFPALPSARQEAAERAEKASALAPSEGPEGAAAPSAAPAEFVCDICGKVFPHNQGLAVHQTRWCIPEQQAQLILTAQQAVGGLAAPLGLESEGPVNCPTCGKLFPTLQGLAIHQTRWCRGSDQTGDGDQPKQPKILHVEPVFRKPDIAPEALVKVEDESIAVRIQQDSETRREPGFTPACHSLAAISVAILWYATRVDAVVRKFGSERSHHSRVASKPSAKSKK